MTTLALALPAGLLIGLSLGALGAGGSILTVPVLVYLLGQRPHDATTGSLVIVGATALAGMLAHRRAGRVRLAAGSVFGLLGVAGSWAGSRMSATVDPNMLLLGFAALMLAAAAAMLGRHGGPSKRHLPPRSGGHIHEAGEPSGGDNARHRGQLLPTTAAVPSHPHGPVLGIAGEGGHAVAAPATAEAQPLQAECSTTGERRHGGHSPAARAIDALKVLLTATAVGLLTGFFGVGGGFVVVPALVLALGFELPVAVGTSLLVIIINSAAALTVRLAGGLHLNVALLATFTTAAVAGSLAGTRVATRLRPEQLTTAFALLLVAVAVYTVVRSLPQLL
jgi:uncharacterized protein